MALFQALISWLGRSTGKLVNAVFGWAVVALFGRTSSKQQTLLSAVVAMAALWPLLLVGVIVPKAIAFLIAFIPPARSIPDHVLRIVWVALAIAVPLVVGLVVASKRAAGIQSEPFGIRLLRGYPITIALAAAFLLIFITVPVLRISSALRGRSDEHVPLITEGDEYRQAVAVIGRLIERHELGARRGEPPWWMSTPSTILKKVGGKSFRAYLPEEFAFWQAPALQIALYPSDVLVRGAKKRAAWTHGVIAEAFARGPGLQTTDPDAQDLERQVQRAWRVFEEDPEMYRGSRALLGRVSEMSRDLGKLEIEWDEWQITYRKIAQLARAIHGEPQLLEQAASKEGEVMTEESAHEYTEERPLQSAPTGELFGTLFRQGSELLRKELELARAEIRETVKATVQVTTGMVIAGLFGLVALGTLCAAAVLGLSNAMEPWMAALAVGVVMLVIAGVMAMVAKNKASKKPLERTQRTLKEDVRWAKERLA